MFASTADGETQPPGGTPTSAIRTRAESLVDPAPPIVGLLLIGLSAGNVVSREETVVHDSLEVAIPFVVGLVVLGLTPSFRDLDLDAESKLEILGTAVVVGVLAATVLLWEHMLLGLDGIALPLDGRSQSVFNGLSVGLLVGGFAGYYRARTKQELRDRSTAEQSYHEVFEKVDGALLVHDFETSAVTEANPKAAELFGHPRADLEGMVVPELTADHPEFDMDAASEKIEATKAGEPQQFEWLIERADGQDCWVEISLKRAELNGETRLLAMLRDISEHNRREQQLADLADARQDFQEIFDKADIGIALNDPETGKVGRVNASYADMLGYDPTELKGIPIGEISADDPDFDQERAGTLMAQAMSGDPQQFDWLLERKDGSQFWAEVSLKHATIGGSPRLLAFVRDVSDRKRREQELEKFQEIHEKADSAIGLTDPETGTIVGANPKYAEILGYEPEELAGMRIEEVSADSPEFSQEKAMEVARDAMAGEPQSIDWLLEREDGSTVWVAVSLKRATIGDEERLLVFFRDVSERKKREKELDRHRSEMEFFNSLLRHDVLNGITVIRTHGGRLADSLDGEQREHAATIVEWADNTTGVVKRVRDVLETLTGDAEPDLEPVDLSKTIRDEIDRLQSAYPDVTFETDLDGEVAVVANDLLEEVVGNVLRNALDHNDTDDLTVSATLEAAPSTVTVRIADDGSGIPEEDREAVFRRGETGHVKKTGSGFGLYFVDAMVSAYGGDVWVENNEPSGSQFVIELSAA